jgi:LysR family glycine cleavage system transcriptional activator
LPGRLFTVVASNCPGELTQAPTAAVHHWGMKIMALRLPPLNSLRLFEAAGRHLSFKVAASELNLTPSAVSHGIQTLEDWLGTELFHRGTRKITLTPAGEAYRKDISQALKLVAIATDAVPGRRATGAVSVSVAPTFASKWLLPRLGGFMECYPGISVEIDTSRGHVEFPLDGIDVAIRMGSEPKPGFAWVLLLREALVPVCSPKLRQRFGTGAIMDVLGMAPLLHVTTTSEDWAEWFQTAGITAPVTGGGIRFDTIQLAVEGAMQSLGIALGRRPLIDQDLEQGKLVILDAPEMRGAASYWLVGKETTFERPEVKLFRSWILAEILGREPGGRATDNDPTLRQEALSAPQIV